MPTQCTYGTQAKAGSPAWLWILWNGFLSFLANHYSRLGPLASIWFPDAPVSVADLCASEPDIPSFPSVLEWAGAFAGNPINAITVGNYLRALFVSSLWPTVCECKPNPSSGTCGSVWAPSQTFNHLFAAGTAYELGVQFQALQAGTHFYGARIWYREVPPSNFTTLDLWDTVTNTLVSSTNFNTASVGANDYFLDNGSAGNLAPYALVTGRNYIAAFCSPAAISGWETTLATPPSDAVIQYIDDRYTTPCGARPTSTFAGWEPINPFICIGGPPSGDVPPYVPIPPQDPTAIPDNPNPACTTTADLCSQITRLLSVVSQTDRQVNWIQATIAPTCWVPLTPITGITGHGTLAVSDIVGAYVSASVPSSWGRTSETPPRFIPEIGSLQFQTDGAPTTRFGLHYASENVLEAVPSTNSIQYNVRSGVTLSITPLARCK